MIVSEPADPSRAGCPELEDFGPARRQNQIVVGDGRVEQNIVERR